jgi:hypothetical protein
MSVLTFRPDGGCSYEVLASSRKSIGWLHPLDDGCLYFFPDDDHSGWPSWVLRQIADKLDELNKPWEDHINETLKP